MNPHDDSATCRWYAMCDHVAIGTISHPILGDIPICRRCFDKYARIGGTETLQEIQRAPPRGLLA